MESPNHNPDFSIGGAGIKRKRTPVPEPTPAPTHFVSQINYLARARNEKLSLIEGDSDTFRDVLGMIDDYEGVLQRHESLAANMGAKLVGPLLLKSFEKLFDGPIRILQTQAPFGLDDPPVSWLSIVTFARANPTEFFLNAESAPGVRCCRFWIKGSQVEISEDDYRLIMSGAPERMIPTQPLEEDKLAELGTLTILEARLAILIKKADGVATKARQLNYHLKGRKSALLARSEQSTDQAEPANIDVSTIQQQLLEQYIRTSSPSGPGTPRRQSIAFSRPKNERVTPSVTTPAASTSEPPNNYHTFNGDNTSLLMASKVEKFPRGEAIFPPCDRCRRLKFDCIKHLTACSACTKKHAKCSWKDVKDGEVAFAPAPMGPRVD